MHFMIGLGILLVVLEMGVPGFIAGFLKFSGYALVACVIGCVYIYETGDKVKSNYTYSNDDGSITTIIIGV